MEHETEIMAFYAYSDKFLKLPKPNRKDEFEEISCKKTAINEIVNWTCDSPHRHVDDILMEFAFAMRATYERKHLMMFEYAARVALELYDYFYTDWDEFDIY